MCDAPRCNAVCLLASGRGIGGAELGRLLAHLHHFILRQQTGELDVLQRAGRDHDADNRRCSAPLAATPP